MHEAAAKRDDGICHPAAFEIDDDVFDLPQVLHRFFTSLPTIVLTESAAGISCLLIFADLVVVPPPCAHDITTTVGRPAMGDEAEGPESQGRLVTSY